MSQSIRQSELFSGEEWRVLYRAFTTINFNASDPPSIAQSMREYIQANYPEDFNDWIESQEFVFILELLAWLGGTLAFKMDINARENFMEVAEARESILRLARFLSYNPRRNQSAQGLLKLVAVETDDDIEDSMGINLNRTVVQWDNPDDPVWLERFTSILNNAFVQNNQFGQPLKSGTVSGVRSHLYRFNNLTSKMSPAFTASANGEKMTFEVCNGDFEDGGTFFERTPNPDSAFHIYHRTDGSGNASPSTGFFMLFKQGELLRQTFAILTPSENQIIDLDTPSVNQNDVWVQTVSDNGSLITEWKKVPALFSENITFNSLPTTDRNVFSVVTRDDDRISVRFSDGRFGTAPVGNIKVWTRTGNGKRYQIRPQDIDRQKVAVPYTNRRGVLKTLTLTFSLQQSVTNSVPRETDEQIRRRAPQVYASQNRMVSGEDYNSFPLQSNIATKLKAVNRVYSGHSRFIDLADPTGTFQDTDVFADDGIFYFEDDDQYLETSVGTTRSPAEIITRNVNPVVNKQSVANYAWSILYTKIQSPGIGDTWTWRQSTIAQFSSTGWIDFDEEMIHFRDGSILEVLTNGVKKWVSIHSVVGAFNDEPVSGQKGPVTLSEPLEDQSTILRVIPRFNPTVPSGIESTFNSKTMEEIIFDGGAFTLWFDWAAESENQWSIREGLTSTTPAESGTAIRILAADYFTGMWRVSARGLRYIFESVQRVRWFYDGQKAVDSLTGTVKADLVRVLAINEDLNDRTSGVLNGHGLGKFFDLSIHDVIRYPDGYAEPRRVNVKFFDEDDDGQPDNPDTCARLIADITQAGKPESYLFWSKSGEDFVPAIKTITVYEEDEERISKLSSHSAGDVAFQLVGPAADNKSFWIVTLDGSNAKVWTRSYSDHRFAIGRGSNVAKRWYAAGNSSGIVPVGYPIAFHWKHYAPSDHRIDPSKTNIIDIFVLTSEYDYRTRQWVANGSVLDDLPLPPSELDLRIAFSEFNNYKMFSDEIIWRPVQYKFLFGEGASPELRAQFKVVKLPNSPISDGEIKSRVIRSINEYFNVEFWDFGETFYYTELAAYIHQKMAGVIGSIVIVPMREASSFGQVFEARSRSDELFLSTAQINDVVLISSNTSSNLRIR